MGCRSTYYLTIRPKLNDNKIHTTHTHDIKQKLF